MFNEVTPTPDADVAAARSLPPVLNGTHSADDYEDTLISDDILAADSAEAAAIAYIIVPPTEESPSEPVDVPPLWEWEAEPTLAPPTDENRHTEDIPPASADTPTNPIALSATNQCHRTGRHANDRPHSGSNRRHAFRRHRRLQSDQRARQ